MAGNYRGQLGPLEARQPPGIFAYARYTGSARCFRARMCCSSEFITPLVVWLVVESTAPVWVQRIVYQVVSDMPKAMYEVGECVD